MSELDKTYKTPPVTIAIPATFEPWFFPTIWVIHSVCNSTNCMQCMRVVSGGQVEHCCPTVWRHPGSLWAPSHWYVFLHGGCGGLRDLFPGSSQWTGLHFWILGWNCGTNTLWHHVNGKIFGWGDQHIHPAAMNMRCLWKEFAWFGCFVVPDFAHFSKKEVVIGSDQVKWRALPSCF